MKLIFSMTLTGTLLLIFGISIGVATFIENDFGTASAQAVVFKALWFELLLTAMVINMIGVIFKQRLYRKEKWGSLLFHVSFIIILLGAAITRFTGKEGLMHIREGETATSFLTDETYISGVVLAGNEKVEFSDKVLFVPIKKARYSESISVGGEDLEIKLLQHIAGAQEIVETNQTEGKPIITVVTTGSSGGRRNIYLHQGQVVNLGNLVLGFDATEQVSVNIKLTDKGLKLSTQVPIQTFSMDTQARGMIEPDSVSSAPFRHLLTIGNTNVVLSAFNPLGQVMLVPTQAGYRGQGVDALVFELKSGDSVEEVVVRGAKGMLEAPKFANVGNLNVMLSYGSKEVQVPFSVKLRDFQLDRYPGSDSPSSYASEVTVKDGDTEFPFRIYMNNILSHRGYRLYQSSYDKDELGTILSINKDKPGTIVTYIGYFLLSVGLLFILFNKNSRFTLLSKKIDKVHARRAALAITMFLFMASNSATAQHDHFEPTAAQADSLSRLIYQTNDGRMAPLHSLASDLVRKVHQKVSYKDYTASQVLMGMMASPYKWQEEPIIQVKNDEIKDLLGISGNYASYNDFFNNNGYKLRTVISAAYEKKPAQRSQFDKDLMKVDERINISYLIYRGDLLKIYPIPNDENNQWISGNDEHVHGLSSDDSVFVRNSFRQYLLSAIEGKGQQANFILSGIMKYQEKFGAEVMPSPSRVELEIKFNELNLFERLYPYFMLTGFLLLILNFVKIFRVKARLKYGILTAKSLIILGFVIHLGGLALRWYISGHEPWSNGYESMIYIAWASLLAGLIFSRKSEMTLAVTAILSGIILFVAHLSWMDPEITNLVPVLKSYWLTIHVATIVASYGFMGLGALLAFVNLITFILKRKSNEKRLNLSIRELTYVIEMTLTFGLILLTIGNFLGGIWANESWGRYWGWDPKETWALASIIFYAFVLHMRFIPGLKSVYAFNLASLVVFASILMTYFGVNYYLSGLHSYAAGDPVPIPTFVYYLVAIVALIGFAAYYNNKRLKTVELRGETDED